VVAHWEGLKVIESRKGEAVVALWEGLLVILSREGTGVALIVSWKGERGLKWTCFGPNFTTDLTGTLSGRLGV
jgi:hypothetical protein